MWSLLHSPYVVSSWRRKCEKNTTLSLASSMWEYPNLRFFFIILNSIYKLKRNAETDTAKQIIINSRIYIIGVHRFHLSLCPTTKTVTFFPSEFCIIAFVEIVHFALIEIVMRNSIHFGWQRNSPKKPKIMANISHSLMWFASHLDQWT